MFYKPWVIIIYASGIYFYVRNLTLPDTFDCMMYQFLLHYCRVFGNFRVPAHLVECPTVLYELEIRLVVKGVTSWDVNCWVTNKIPEDLLEMIHCRFHLLKCLLRGSIRCVAL